MLNPSLNQLFVYVCIAVITGAPFYFRYWLSRWPALTLSQIDKRVSILTTSIFVALFAGAFVFGSDSRALGEILLGAAILSFSFLYQSRAHYFNRATPAKKISTARALKINQKKLGFILALCLAALACSQFPLLAPVLVIAYPFITPYLIRLQHHCEKMAESGLKSSILEVFTKANVNLREIYLIDTGTQKASNAFVANRTLFLTLDLFEALNEDELNAVIAHEASHLKMKHISKRIFQGIGYFFLTLFWISVPATFLFNGNPLAVAVSAFLAIFAQMIFISRIVYRQELEADLGAIRLGASGEALISALHKLSPARSAFKSPMVRFFSGAFHPTNEERTAMIRMGELPQKSVVLPKKAYFLAYSLFVVGYVFHAAQSFEPDSNRSLASNSAKISRVEKTQATDESHERVFQ